VKIIRNNFSRNQAFLEGGVLKYTTKEPIFLNNTLSSNKADFYGDDIAAFPLRMRLKIKHRMETNNTFIDIVEILKQNGENIFALQEERTGMPLSVLMLFEVIDIYGSIVKSVSERFINYFNLDLNCE
jgi:hypothetical protein